jgi:alkylation response protein AidB-like acyl-CoA dehydrogenase
MSVQLFPEATQEQRLMADSAIRAMEAEYPLTAVREAAERSEPAAEKLWRALGRLGCFGLLASEDDGGGTLSGNGVADAAIIAAERGARLAPGPFVGTQVVVGTLSRIARAAPLPDGLLESLLSGQAAATWATWGLLDDPRGPGLTVTEAPDGVTLSGVVRAVPDAGECDWILVTAPVDGAVRQFLVDRRAAGLSLRKADGLDITRRYCDLTLADVQVTELAGETDSPDTVDNSKRRPAALADWQVAVAAVLSAAESVGAMDANFTLALEYSKTRIAFGRPIGSFQGLKHLLARTSLALEMAKALVAGAAEAIGSNAADGPSMASMARAFVSENAIELTQNCFQVFGGIGFTWEHDQHLYMRRLASEAYLFGSPSWHRRRIWRLSSGGATPRTPRGAPDGEANISGALSAPVSDAAKETADA